MGNQGAKGQEAAGPEQSIPTAEDVYQGLISAGLDSDQAFRATEAIREQAGRNIADKLETLQVQVVTVVASSETRLTAKIEGVRTELTAKIAGVDAKVAGVDAKVDVVRTEMTAKVDVVRTEMTSKVDGVRTELEAMKGKLTFLKWALSFVAALLTLILIVGLAPIVGDWLGRDSTPAESGQAPVDPDRTEPADPPEPEPPAAPPPQAGSLLRDGLWFPHRDGAGEREYDFQVLARKADWQPAGRFGSVAKAAWLAPSAGDSCRLPMMSGLAGFMSGELNAPAGWRTGVNLYRQRTPSASDGLIPASMGRGLGPFQVKRLGNPHHRAALPGAHVDSVATHWQLDSQHGGVDPPATAKFSAVASHAWTASSGTPGSLLPFCGQPGCRWHLTTDFRRAMARLGAATPLTAIAVAEQQLQYL